jgi:hypothetical protein
MGHLRLHLSAVWQLAAIAIMVMMDLSSVDARKYKPPKIPVCGEGCKRNKKGHLVCRIPGTWRVAFCPRGELASSGEPSPAPSDLDFLDPAPSPYDDLYSLVQGPFENFYDFVDFYEPTGYLYDDREHRYEYEDRTVVPGFEAPAPNPVDFSLPRRRRCRRHDISCRKGCRRGRCCLRGRQIRCRNPSFRNFDDADPPESYVFA